MAAPESRLRWADLYREAELYKAAIRLYTKPLFNWRKALSVSTDEHTLYDFARRGLKNLHGMHNALAGERFHYRPGRALRFSFNGKERTLYVYPWEERLVDLLLYRLLTRRLNPWFSPHSYAYRDADFGVDVCQRRIARALYADGGARFVVKRDISDYFGSVDHELLLEQLRGLVEPSDFLFALLRERVRFVYQEGEAPPGAPLHTARRGIPFGTAVACLFANVHLTGLDRSLEAVPGLSFFRYADDILLVSGSREAAEAGRRALDDGLAALRLRSKPSHERQIFFTASGGPASPPPDFEAADRLRHLGLEFRADGVTRLSRDKFRKICNRFRFAFRRQSGLLRRTKDPLKRAAQLVRLSREVLERGIRNVAIIDYYLRHVDDESQLRLLDRWLAEEVLAIAFESGHRKGLFGKLGFRRLREMGLPSLVHRRRLIRHGHVESTFLAWRNTRMTRGSGGAAVRPEGRPNGAGAKAFSPDPEAAVANAS